MCAGLRQQFERIGGGRFPPDCRACGGRQAAENGRKRDGIVVTEQRRIPSVKTSPRRSLRQQEKYSLCLFTVFLVSKSLEKGEIQSAEMSPARVRRLIAEVEAWRKANHIKQKDLAASLGMSPQQLNNIIQDREDPTGEQTLHMQELIRTKPVEKPKEK